ncbi:MAG: hypothetical protein DMG55_33255, partial [Acidobacteria bacterium]
GHFPKLEYHTSLSAAADLTPWLCESNAQLDGALADLAHTLQSVHSGTYARDANGQSFGLVQANFVPDATHLATRALERAAVTCFRSAIASFISFLDRLIVWLANCYFSSHRACNIVLFGGLARVALVVADFKGIRDG